MNDRTPTKDDVNFEGEVLVYWDTPSIGLATLDDFDATIRFWMPIPDPPERCSRCDGEGGKEVPRYRDPVTLPGEIDPQAWVDCPDCGGTGWVNL